MNRFSDKVVLVTGAATGIGLETVLRLRTEGAIVYAAHLGEEAPVDSPGLRPLLLDVTVEQQWRDAIDRITAEAGRLDVLVNNAGTRASGTVEETDLKLWYHLIDTNLTSAFLGCRTAVPAIRKSGGGAIVNVSSITGIRGTENMVAYSASKSGLIAMTSSLALDLAKDHIRVNAVCPAAIRTRMVTSWLSQSENLAAAEAALLLKHPIGRIGEAKDVAGVIAFLASEDAAFMTGLAIPVDGGRSIR
jgi:NAD(P)-dependent dehydrogenase (short-subunit alcohol dehydrogenase family)